MQYFLQILEDYSKENVELKKKLSNESIEKS